ncbi:MAG TPA: Lrp/AsnC family transcriptional regulator [Burkholderiales bacterium]|jgi:DNA-binding Lrp family transcriptional regulator|nr:Lrp/AsnC family transcriptional regulator [Burkholderiales bacterium]
MDAAGFRLLNDFQRGFPLCERPYLEIAQRLGQSEHWVLAKLARLELAGVVGRIGAVFAPNTIGASTLVAAAVPPEALERVAQAVNRFPEVNHNYERDHAFNLWFVVTAADSGRLARTLAAIERQAQCGPLLSLPLLEEYRIDLGFDLRDGHTQGGAAPALAARVALDRGEQCLVAAVEEGLLLVPRPYAALADCCGLSEKRVLETLQRWQVQGLIRRFGVIVRHRPLGFRANAMVVWDVPDAAARGFGLRLAADPRVSLCYRRARAERWNYNLYCMLHGREEAQVRERLAGLRRAAGLESFPCQVLFSRRSFKQTAARYAPLEVLADA